MSKLNAKWLNFDTQSLQNSSGNLQIHIDSTANTILKTAAGIKINEAGLMLLSGNQSADGIKTFTSIPILPSSNPTTDNQAVRKAYVDELLSGLSWKNPIYTSSQLADGGAGTGGIRPAVYIDIRDYTKWANGNTIEIDWNDGTAKSVTLTAVSGAAGNDQFTLGGIASNSDLSDEIIRCINDSTTPNLSIFQTNSESFLSTVYIVNDNAIVFTSFVLNVTADADGYRKGDGNVIPNKGMEYSEIVKNQTHFARANDCGYTWDTEDNSWIQISGVGSLPLSTKDQKGVVQIGDGIAIDTGVISLDLYTNGGLELTGSSPNKQLRISSNGVITSMINWGVDTTSHINASSIPIIDSESKFTASDIENALSELKTDIGNVDVTGGAGITSSGTIGSGGITVSVDLGSNPGLELVGESNAAKLLAKVNTNKGLVLTTDGIEIKLRSAGGLMFDTTSGEIYVTSEASENKKVERITLTSTDISNKYIDLSFIPNEATFVQMSIVGGIQQLYGTDFSVITDGSNIRRLSWDGTPLETDLIDGDIIIVWYVV